MSGRCRVVRMQCVAHRCVWGCPERHAAVWNSNAVTSSFTYDPTFHQLATATDPLSHTTTVAYDSLGNVQSVTDPIGRQVGLTVTAQGLPSLIKDALNHQTQIGANWCI